MVSICIRVEAPHVFAGPCDSSWKPSHLCGEGAQMVEAPAFMRGKERLSAPEKNLDFDHAL